MGVHTFTYNFRGSMVPPKLTDTLVMNSAIVRNLCDSPSHLWASEAQSPGAYPGPHSELVAAPQPRISFLRSPSDRVPIEPVCLFVHFLRRGISHLVLIYNYVPGTILGAYHMCSFNLHNSPAKWTLKSPLEK